MGCLRTRRRLAPARSEGALKQLRQENPIVDSELLRTTALLVTLGVSFFLMRRHGGGCSHAATHGAGSQNRADDSETKDPVCGMSVEPHKAAAQVFHEGRTYFFCSLSCRERFAKDASRFLANTQRSCH